MKFKLKELPNLEKEIHLYERNSDSLPVILLDTGALIDLEQSGRRSALRHNKCLEPKNYHIPSFLSLIRKKIPLVVTPHVFSEITAHMGCRINEHIPEINHETFKYIEGIVDDSLDFLGRTRTETPLDDARYDIYWTSKQACKYNHKKHEEGFSEADKDILVNAIRISGSYIKEKGKKYLIKPVIVFSPDQHMGEGVKFINKNLSDKYSKLENLSTRYRK